MCKGSVMDVIVRFLAIFLQFLMSMREISFEVSVTEAQVFIHCTKLCLSFQIRFTWDIF